MNNWDNTLQRFRALGGIVDNVELREGIFGRGLFAINPNLPVAMSVPEHLLCHTDWLQFDAQGKLILTDDCDWNDETKSFYLDYQQYYGIGGILIQQMIQQQTEFFNLPETIKSILIGYGMGKYLFKEPDLKLCLDIYKFSRRIYLAEEKYALMPIIELVNHDERSKKTFNKDPNIGISGSFKDEILIHYGMAGDASLMFENYRFSTPKPYAFSGSLAINLGGKVIKISRFVNIFTKNDKTNMPKLKVQGNEIHLSYLVIGSVNDKYSPKKAFTRLMETVGMPANIASNVFDGIVEQNKKFLLHLLEELKPLEGSVADGLRTMAKHQLIPLGVRV